MTPLKNKIPTARELLKNALELNMPSEVRVAIEQALNLMYRESYKSLRAKPTSRTMTAKLRDEITTYYWNNPDTSTQQIADYFSVNQGRISEVLGGHYDHLV